MTTAPTRAADRAALLDEHGLRALLDRLCALERGSGSDGEREAAALVASELEALGCTPVVERERVHGTYWWPIGLATGAAALAGLRGGRAGVVIGALAAALAADDIAVGRRPLRRLLRGRETRNITAELGDPDAERTLLLVAHYDAAHSGIVFHPGVPRFVLGHLPPKLLARTNTTPPTMWPAVGGPLAVAAGSALGSARLRRFGALTSANFAAAMADIGARGVVPGANDNATGVAALLSLARWLAAEPPAGLRVLLLFTGSEESIMEGMAAWARRHLHELPRERTHVICLDTVGSPRLALLEGEGMLGIREYDKPFLALLEECAADEGIELCPGLRLRNATDGFLTLRAGYTTAMVGSVDEFKIPSEYHWPTDTPDRVDYGSVAEAARLCARAVERLRT